MNAIKSKDFAPQSLFSEILGDLLEKHVTPLIGLNEYAERDLASFGRKLIEVRDGAMSTNIEFDQGWSIGASLSVRMDYSFGTDENEEYRMTFTPHVEITWSSNNRSVGSAAAAIKLYSDVVAIAGLIEWQLDHRGPFIAPAEKKG